MDSPTKPPKPAADGSSHATFAPVSPALRPAEASFKIVVLAGPMAGVDFPLDWDEFTVGRASDNQVSIADGSVSRWHVRFTRAGQRFDVTDLNSGNGIALNGTRVSRALMQHGDKLRIGDTVLQLIDYTAVLPERLKPINNLRSPSGSISPPTVSTEVERAKVVPEPPKKEETPSERTLPPKGFRILT